MKSIQLTQQQIKAYENRASVFMFPIIIKIERLNSETDVTFYCEEENRFKFLNKREFIKMYSPLQIGDKNVWTKEDLVLCKQCGEMIYQFNYHKNPKCPKCGESFITEKAFQPASQMTKEQSRYTLKEILNVNIVRVQDLKLFELLEITRKPIVLAKSIGFCDKQHIKFKEKYFIDFYNQQLKEQNINSTYQDNDYIFLAEIKR